MTTALLEAFYDSMEMDRIRSYAERERRFKGMRRVKAADIAVDCADWI